MSSTFPTISHHDLLPVDLQSYEKVEAKLNCTGLSIKINTMVQLDEIEIQLKQCKDMVVMMNWYIEPWPWRIVSRATTWTTCALCFVFKWIAIICWFIACLGWHTLFRLLITRLSSTWFTVHLQQLRVGSETSKLLHSEQFQRMLVIHQAMWYTSER